MAAVDPNLMIRAENLTRAFRVGDKPITVLRGVSLEVAAGERVFLTGASGAGKTTLLYTLAGLERPDSGTVWLRGEDIYNLPRPARAERRNRGMGYIFQNYYLLPELTALENVLLPSLIRGRPDRARAHSLLGRVGLGERTGHLPSELSGGEQQRVAIARSLMNDPDILFADEPTGNLDSTSGRAVMDALLSLVAESQKALIVVSHDTALAELGDRKLVLADGRLVA